MILAFCPPLTRGRVAGRDWPAEEDIMKTDPVNSKRLTTSLALQTGAKPRR